MKTEEKNKVFKKSKMGLRGRLLGMTIPILAATAIIAMVSTFNMTQKIIEQRTVDNVENVVGANVNEIDELLGGSLKELLVYKNVLSDTALKAEDFRRIIMNTYQIDEHYPNGLYYVEQDGDVISADGWIPEAGYDAAAQDYFIEGLTHNDGFELGSPYADNATGNIVVTASANLSVNGQTSVLAADIPITSILEYVKGIEFFDGNGAVLLVNQEDGSIMAATTMDDNRTVSVTGNVQKLYDDITSSEMLSTINGTMEYKVGSDVFYLGGKQLTGSNWKMISYVSKQDAVLQELKVAFFSILVNMIIIIVIASALIAVFINRKSRQIRGVTASIQKVTDGDFTEHITISSTDETGVMEHSLQNFLDVMKDMLVRLKNMTRMLTEQSDNSMTMSKELAGSSAAQVNAMQEMIHTLEQLSNSVEDIAESSTSLANNVSDTNDRCKHANDVLMDTVSLANSGREEMDEVSASMSQIQQIIDELGSVVESVGDNMRNITNMVDVIGDIAGQTNLLSLNASIEAARAGEAGKGFAVVAHEIGNLAENSSKSVVDIKAVTDGITNQVTEMVNKMKETMISIKGCGEVVEKTSDTFNSINTKIMDTKEEVVSIIGSVAELDTISQSLAAITEEQSASSEEMLATSEDILGHSERVKESAQDGEDAATQLLHIVGDLDKLLEFFKYES